MTRNYSVVYSEKSGPQKRLDFDKDEVTIGRVPGNDIVLERTNVSKRHSRVVRQDGRFFIVDLKSTNGTYLNGRRITTPSVIRPGDKIFVGDFVLLVEPPGDGGAATIPPPEDGSDASMPADIQEEGSLAGDGAVEALPLDDEPPESVPPPANIPPGNASLPGPGAGLRGPTTPGTPNAQNRIQTGPMSGGSLPTAPKTGLSGAPGPLGGNLGAGGPGSVPPRPSGLPRGPGAGGGPSLPGPGGLPGAPRPNANLGTGAGQQGYTAPVPGLASTLQGSGFAPMNATAGSLGGPPGLGGTGSGGPGGLPGPRTAGPNLGGSNLSAPPGLGPNLPKPTVSGPGNPAASQDSLEDDEKTPPPSPNPLHQNPSHQNPSHQNPSHQSPSHLGPPPGIGPSASQLSSPPGLSVGSTPPISAPSSLPFGSGSSGPGAAPMGPIGGGPSMVGAGSPPGLGTPSVGQIPGLSGVPGLATGPNLGAVPSLGTPNRGGPGALPGNLPGSLPTSPVAEPATTTPVQSSSAPAISRPVARSAEPPAGREYAQLLQRVVGVVVSSLGGTPPDALGDNALLAKVRSAAETAVKNQDLSSLSSNVPGLSSESVVRDVVAELASCGPVETAFTDGNVNTVVVDPSGKVFLGRGGPLESSSFWFSSPTAAAEALRRLVVRSGQTSPAIAGMVDVCLPNGLRVLGSFSGFGASLAGPFVVERAFGGLANLQDLTSQGLLTNDVAALLQQVVSTRLNVLVAGPRNSGRTSLLSGLLSSAAQAGERCVVVENQTELSRGSEIVSVSAHGDWSRAIDLAMRLRPKRVALGDINEKTAGAFALASATGADGVLLVVDAPSPELAVSRVVALAAGGSGLLREEVSARFVATKPVIVQTVQLPDGRLTVASVGRLQSETAGRFTVVEWFALRAGTLTSTGTQPDLSVVL